MGILDPIIDRFIGGVIDQLKKRMTAKARRHAVLGPLLPELEDWWHYVADVLVVINELTTPADMKGVLEGGHLPEVPFRVLLTSGADVRSLTAEMDTEHQTAVLNLLRCILELERLKELLYRVSDRDRGGTVTHIYRVESHGGIEAVRERYAVTASRFNAALEALFPPDERNEKTYTLLLKGRD